MLAVSLQAGAATAAPAAPPSSVSAPTAPAAPGLALVLADDGSYDRAGGGNLDPATGEAVPAGFVLVQRQYDSTGRPVKGSKDAAGTTSGHVTVAPGGFTLVTLTAG